MFCLVTLNPLLTSDGSRPTLRACNAEHPALTGFDDKRWIPAITKAPSLGMKLFDGDFSSPVDPGTAAFTIRLDTLALAGGSVGAWRWAGAPVSIAVVPGLTMRSAANATATSETMFKGIVDSFTIEAATLSITAKVDTSPFDVDALTLSYAGTGGAEGGSDLKGKLKPWILGKAANVEPVLIDSDNSVLQFSGYGPIKAIDALYERGSAFGASIGDYATYDALVAADIPAGSWATCLAHGMVRLGAPPFGVITGDIEGDQPAGGTFAQLTGAIIQRVASNAGVDSDLIDTDSLDGLDTAAPYPIGIVLTDQSSVLDLARRLARPCNAQAGVSWLGKLFVTRVAFSTSAMTLDAQGRQRPPVIKSTENAISPPYKRIQMGGDRCWRVQTLDEIAFEAALIERGVYAAATTYREGNIVTLTDGSRWLYTATTASAGNTPADGSDFWSQLNGPTEVDWSTGVTGAGKPDDNATVGATVGDANNPGNLGKPGGGTYTDDDIDTSKGTSKDTANVGGRPVEDLLSDLDGAMSDIDDLFATYGDTASANEAMQAAQAAQAAAEADAQTSAQNAADAEGYATTASGKADIATQKADDAEQSAINSAASSDTSSTKAGQAAISQQQAAISEANALGYKNAAAASETLSANSADAAVQATAAAFPRDFAAGIQFWGNLTGSPAAQTQASNLSNPDTSSGAALRITSPTQNQQTRTRNLISTSLAGRTFRIIVTVRLSTPPTSGVAVKAYTNFYGLGGDYQTIYYSGYIDQFTTPPGTVRLATLPADGSILTIAVQARIVASPVCPWLAPSFYVGTDDGSTMAGATVDILSYDVDDITDLLASEDAANASAQSASSAATSETAAGQSASAAHQDRLDAEAANGAAQTAAQSTASDVAVATAQAAAAQQSALLSAQAGSGDANLNSMFASWPNPNSWPAYWGYGPTGITPGTNMTRVAGITSAYAARVAAAAGANCYFNQTGVGAPWTANPGDWVVLEADIKLNSGSLVGAGMTLRVNGSGETLLSFAADPTTSGNVVAAGVPGQTYSYRKLIRIPAGPYTAPNLYAMNHWTSFGSIAAANDITWYRCGWRPASAAEIKTGQIDDLAASVATNAGAIANLQTGKAEASTVTALQATVGDQAAAIQDVEQVAADAKGTANAIVGLKLDVNGKISGTYSENDGETSKFGVLSDVFEVSGGTGLRTEYSNGSWKVYYANGQLALEFGIYS